ncbi:MAG: (2Fe-2S)-binding protein [Pseudorhodoplanes sp.]|uniref:(2Fe-2S)-binding protein n=1 Tax=Pseudorhodoplanes sp. TaxID=1934341 RepID=UPI003D10D437
MKPITFRLNGDQVTFVGDAQTPLIDVIREQLELTAAKVGCGIGRCGTCLVLVDGLPTNACMLGLYRLHGRSVITPEGLSDVREGRAVRAALVAEVSFQCGYCAPGFTIAATALLLKTPTPDEEEIREALAGNLCRCSGYLAIVRAVQKASSLLEPAPDGDQRLEFHNCGPKQQTNATESARKSHP